MNSILPSVVEIAQHNNLNIDLKTLGKKEVLADCPWCVNALKKYNLAINPDKNVFKCYACGNHGGAVDFIMVLENKTRDEVWNEIRKDKGIKKKDRSRMHPAKQLSGKQRALIGFGRTSPSKSINAAYEKRELDWIWSEWMDYLERKKREAFLILLAGINSGTYQKSIASIKELSTSIEFELLPSVFEAYGHNSDTTRPEWAHDAVTFAREVHHSFENIMPSRMAH